VEDIMRFFALIVLVAGLLWCTLCFADLGSDNKDKVDKWLEELESSDKALRRNAIKQINRHSSPVILHELARHARTHTDPAIRGYALQKVVNAREGDYTELFRSILEKDKHIFPRVMAAEGLAKKGDKSACSVFLEALKDENLYIKFLGVRAMFYVMPEGAEEKLIEIVEGRKPPQLVSSAVVALGEHKVTKADQAILDFIKVLSPDSIHQRTCLSALSKLGTQPAADYIIKRTGNLTEEKHPSTVILSLGRLRESKKALEILQTLAKFSGNKSWRIFAINALAKTAAPEALDTLIEIMKGGWEKRYKYCLPAICKFEGKKATRALLTGTAEANDNRARLKAIEELVRRKESRVIELCMKLLDKMQNSGYTHFTAAAVKAMAAFDDPAVIPHVLDSLALTFNKAEHWSALRALRKFGKETVVPYYLKLVKKQTKNWHLKDSICEELMELQVEGLVKLFGEQLNGETDHNMRVQYARLLGKFASREAVPYLLSAFRKEKLCVCFDAILDALGECRDESAVKLILELKGSHFHIHWRVHACLALGKIGSQEAMEEVYEDFEKTTDAKIKAAAAMAIAMSGDRAHVHKLLDLLKSKVSNKLREAIIEGFVRLNDPAIQPYLLECVEGKHGSLAVPKALLAFGKLSGDAPKYLRKMLPNAGTRLRNHVVDLLLDLGDKNALPAIRKKLEDKNVSFARVVAVMLIVHGDTDSIPGIRKLIKRSPAGSRRYELRERLLNLEEKAKAK
jgi:HEAT repeat protein